MVMSVSASAQTPQLTSAGIVNAGSYAQPISPGSIVSIFGINLAITETTAKSLPLPTNLAGTSVTFDGVKAPLFYVSPGQINLQAPSSLQTSYAGNYTSSTVMVTTPSGSSVAVQVPVYLTGPAVFTVDSSGCGRAAALNVAADGRVSLNSPSNSAAPGDYISVYGTGLGLTVNQPADGFPTGADSIRFGAGVWVDGSPLPASTYAGLAPGLVGVDQVNFRIPLGVREGCAVPLALQADALISPTVTISIHSGRGQCVDPAAQSYGQISLMKTVASGTANDGESDMFTAAFPSGPGLMPPQVQVLSPGSYAAHASTVVPVSRSCQVAGYAQFSAGPIQVQAASTGTSFTVQPVSQTGGAAYEQSLPAGFIAPGQYTISASGGAVVFQGKLSVGSPIRIQTPLPAGTTISSSKPLNINWTGGDQGAVVKVTLVSGNGIASTFDYGYADASSGSFTLQPSCSGFHPVFCSFSLPTSNNAEIIVEISPAPDNVSSFTANGVTGGVQASWTYRYVFGGLVLGE